MPASPIANAEGPVRVVLQADGRALDEVRSLVRLSVRRALNRVPAATLEFLDGDMPRREFPLSDSPHLKPGVELTVRAGYGDDEEPIFKGLVVKHGITIGGANDARLVIECRDAAIKMTVGRRNAHYENQTDADVARKLITAHGLAATVSGLTLQHAELVQHYCSDWDFLLARAEAGGGVVIASDGTVTVGAPETDGAAALAVTYGESLIDFEAELDARHQYAEVAAQAWDAKTQALLAAAPARPAALNEQGNLDSKALAKVLGLERVTLQTAAALPKPALDGWAKAQQLKSGLARLRGRMRFQGSAKAVVGGVIDLVGVGERFSGAVYVTGLTHRVEQGNWTTEVEFGSAPEWFIERTDIVAPPAAGWVPGIEGLHIGVVRKLDADPAGECRVQVELPAAGVPTLWARLAQFHASKAFGAFFLPEIGDEVLVGFLANDPSHAVVLGSLYSSNHKPPYALQAENNTKALVTRCLAKLEIDDKDKVITLTTPGKNTIVLSDKDKSITLTDQNSNRVKLSADGITIDSPKDIQISAKGKITVSAVGELALGSKADAKLDGLNVACNAQVGITAKGSASAELSAAGQTTVKGAMVMIN